MVVAKMNRSRQQNGDPKIQRTACLPKSFKIVSCINTKIAQTTSLGGTPKQGEDHRPKVILIFRVQKKQWWKKMPTDGTLLTTKDALADNLLRHARVSIPLRMFKESFWLKA
jgi:hypothetical protein